MPSLPTASQSSRLPEAPSSHPPRALVHAPLLCCAPRTCGRSAARHRSSIRCSAEFWQRRPHARVQRDPPRQRALIDCKDIWWVARDDARQYRQKRAPDDVSLGPTHPSRRRQCAQPLRTLSRSSVGCARAQCTLAARAARARGNDVRAVNGVGVCRKSAGGSGRSKTWRRAPGVGSAPRPRATHPAACHRCLRRWAPMTTSPGSCQRTPD